MPGWVKSLGIESVGVRSLGIMPIGVQSQALKPEYLGFQNTLKVEIF